MNYIKTTLKCWLKMASVVKHTLKGASALRLSQLTKANIAGKYSVMKLPLQNDVTFLATSCSLAYKNTSNPSYQLTHNRFIHTNTSLMSRIKWRYTHKPYFHTKKTSKAEQSPLTYSNRAFLDKILQDTYQDEQLGERYAYVAPPNSRNKNDKSQNTNCPLKAEHEPWSRGSWEECGVATTRIGLIGRKIGVVPMWLMNGKQVLATMLHIEDNHVIRYISAEDFSKTVVAQRRIRPYIMKPTASISRGSIVVGALSADPSKFTKDYCGLFTESGVMPKKKLVRFPGKLSK